MCARPPDLAGDASPWGAFPIRFPRLLTLGRFAPSNASLGFLELEFPELPSSSGFGRIAPPALSGSLKVSLKESSSWFRFPFPFLAVEDLTAPIVPDSSIAAGTVLGAAIASGGSLLIPEHVRESS